MLTAAIDADIGLDQIKIVDPEAAHKTWLDPCYCLLLDFVHDMRYIRNYEDAGDCMMPAHSAESQCRLWRVPTDTDQGTGAVLKEA